ncbi:MAG: C40 family peptidase [Candidatus Nanopelagicales bacterium]
MRVRQSRMRRTALAAGAGVIVAALTTAAAVPGSPAPAATGQAALPALAGADAVDPKAPAEAVADAVAAAQARAEAELIAAEQAAAAEAARVAAEQAAAAEAARVAAEQARIAAEQAAADAARQSEQRIIDAAAAASGGSYRWGGTTPKGFDCSGYVQYVFRQVAISLPRTSAGQRAATTKISQSEARPGDLVFQARGRRVHHVSIYAGDGMVYEALQAGTRVGLKPLRVGAGTSFGRVS